MQTNQCGGAISPCQNNGVCNEGWNRPLCDCSATLYTGPTCGRESQTLAFNGTQHMTIWLGGAQGSRTQTEELVLRFKTARPAGLLLLTSAESNSPDRLDISLVAGRVRASVRMGEREKVRTYFCILFCNYFPNITFSPRSFSPARVCSTTTIGTRFGSHGAPRTFGFRLTGLPPSGVRYVCINSTLFAPINACRDVSLKKELSNQTETKTIPNFFPSSKFQIGSLAD